MKFLKENINTFIIIAILAMLNVVGSYVFKRFDLTEEKRYSISQPTKAPVVAFTTGHGEVPQENLGEVIEELQEEQFAVSTLDLSVGIKIDELVDVLVISKPTIPFTEKEKYKIDQYLMRGGKIIWLMDQMAVEMDSLQGKDFFMANAIV